MINSFDIQTDNPIELAITSLLYFGGYSTNSIIQILLNNSCSKRNFVTSQLLQEKLIKKIPVRINDHHLYQVTKKLCVALDEKHSRLFRNRDYNINLIKNNLRKNLFSARYYKVNPNSFALKKEDKIKVLTNLADNMTLADIPCRHFGSGNGKYKRILAIEEFIQCLGQKTLIYFIHKEDMDSYYLLSLFFTRYIYILSKTANPLIPVMVFFDSKSREQAKELLSNKHRNIKLSFCFYTTAEVDQFFEFNLFLKKLLDNQVLSLGDIKKYYEELTSKINSTKLPVQFDLSYPIKLLPRINTCIIQHPILS